MSRVKTLYLIDLALFIQFILVGGSGLIMYFFHNAGGHLLRLIHDKIGIVMFVFFLAHIILNWKWIIFTTKKIFIKKAEVGT